MVILHFIQTFKGVFSEFAGMGYQVMIFDVVEGRQGGCASDGTFFMGVVTHCPVTGHIQRFVGYDGRHRKYTAAQSLAQNNDIRNHTEIFKGKHPAGAAEGMGDFIKN